MLSKESCAAVLNAGSNLRVSGGLPTDALVELARIARQRVVSVWKSSAAYRTIRWSKLPKRAVKTFFWMFRTTLSHFRNRGRHAL
jgi:hypothetical protein